MTDYADLKAAATYAAQDVIKFSDESEEIRALQQFHEEVDPETVLALIAENERLSADCSSMRGSLKANAVSIKKLIKDGGRAARERDQLKAENERLEVEVKRMTSIAYAAHGAFRMETMAERDQLRAEVAGLKTGYEAYEQVNAELKAEVEGLRRERAGKILCDLELFETLRDSANTEADEHRQCMATYRPLRQASLDSVVKKCDDLLAALGQGEQS